MTTPTTEEIERLEKQAAILDSMAVRFRGEYAWIEKARAHACDVAMIFEEGARRMRCAAETLSAKDREIEELEGKLEACEQHVTICQKANTEEAERRRKAEFKAVQLAEANDEEVKRRLEILVYLRERCRLKCAGDPGYQMHEPNCPVADLELEKK